ncbi:MAG: molybdenum cofactor guanylyltransferase [Vulcanimicrobiaceae bacterium]
MIPSLAGDLGSIGILVLGGGEATRLPGKLTLAAGERPMIARVLRNVAPACDARPEIVISAKHTFARDVDALLDAPIVVDRWDRRGPLGGMLASFARMHARFVFVVAGDAPFVDAALIARLARAYERGDEAIVPVHGTSTGATERSRERIEPLAALYDRLAFVREGMPVLRAGRGALHVVIARLRARFVTVDEPATFANVNTPADYDAIGPRLTSPPSDQGATR